jgi:hypothetical protein
MSAFDRQFEIVKPDLTYLIRHALPVADTGLITYDSTSPLALCDGELVQINTSNQYIRATDVAAPSFFVWDTRGTPEVKASGKLSAVIGGSSFVARTFFFDAALSSIGAGVGLGPSLASANWTGNRAGLAAVSTNYRLGTVLRVASVGTRNRLEVLLTGL